MQEGEKEKRIRGWQTRGFKIYHKFEILVFLTTTQGQFWHLLKPPNPTQLLWVNLNPPNYPIIKITKIPLKWKTQISRLHHLSFSGSKSEVGKFHQISIFIFFIFFFCHHPLNKIFQNPTNLNPSAHFLQPHFFPPRLIAKKTQEKLNYYFSSNQTLPKKWKWKWKSDS